MPAAVAQSHGAVPSWTLSTNQRDAVGLAQPLDVVSFGFVKNLDGLGRLDHDHLDR